MPIPTIARGVVWERGGCTLFCQIIGWNGLYLQRADISSITYSIIDKTTSTPVEGYDGATLSASDVVFDSLQSDPAFESVAHHVCDGEDGYNFRLMLGDDAFPIGGRVYQVVVRINPVGASSFPLAWDLRALELEDQ